MRDGWSIFRLITPTRNPNTGDPFFMWVEVPYPTMELLSPPEILSSLARSSLARLTAAHSQADELEQLLGLPTPGLQQGR